MSTVPPNGLILVTGANGYIASVTITVLLRRGYRVRGTVRSAASYAWMSSHYGPAFDLFEVSELSAAGALDNAMKDVDGVAHLASNLTMDPADTSVIDKAVRCNLELLRSASRCATIKSVVMTSSQGACVWPLAGVPYEIKTETFNNWAVEQSDIPWTGERDGFEKGLINYAAAKTLAEQESWAWIKENEPPFSFNVVVPNINWGTATAPDKLGYRSSAAVLHSLVKGHSVAPAMLPVQWYVDVEDTALLHLAALTLGEVQRERIFAMAGPYSYTQMLEILRRRFPEKQAVLPSIEEVAVDCGKVDNHRASELLKKMGKHQGFTSLEETLVKAMNIFVEYENVEIPQSDIERYAEAMANTTSSASMSS